MRLLTLHADLAEVDPSWRAGMVRGSEYSQVHEEIECLSADNKGMIQQREGMTSMFRGVSLHGASGKWRAQIGSKHLGLFEDQVTAALAAYRARQEHRYLFTEDPDLEELAAFLGPTALTREAMKQPRSRSALGT